MSAASAANSASANNNDSNIMGPSGKRRGIFNGKYKAVSIPADEYLKRKFRTEEHAKQVANIRAREHFRQQKKINNKLYDSDPNNQEGGRRSRSKSHRRKSHKRKTHRKRK